MSVKREACPHRKSIMIILVVGMYSCMMYTAIMHTPRQLFIRICACFQPCEHTHTHTTTHMHCLYVCVRTYIHECTYMYMYIRICMYVCMYIYVYV